MCSQCADLRDQEVIFSGRSRILKSLRCLGEDCCVHCTSWFVFLISFLVLEFCGLSQGPIVCSLAQCRLDRQFVFLLTLELDLRSLLLLSLSTDRQQGPKILTSSF